MKHIFTTLRTILAASVLLVMAASCDDDTSYADLLRAETEATNLYLSQFRVELTIPEDSVFEVGEDAPFYLLDEDRNVYMQVLDPGDDERPATGDRVYFRYMRWNLKYYEVGGTNYGAGNANTPSADSSTYFFFNDFYSTESANYGEGLQMPCYYLGWNARVKLVVKSQAGPSTDTSVIPYLYEISYYKPMI